MKTLQAIFGLTFIVLITGCGIFDSDSGSDNFTPYENDSFTVTSPETAEWDGEGVNGLSIISVDRQEGKIYFNYTNTTITEGGYIPITVESSLGQANGIAYTYTKYYNFEFIVDFSCDSEPGEEYINLTIEERGIVELSPNGLHETARDLSGCSDNI